MTFTFSCFYFLETLIQLYVLGFERFWYRKPFQHRFDLANNYSLFACEVIYLFIDPPGILLRLSILQHIARVVRLLFHVRALRQLANVMARLAPTVWRLGLLTVIVYYVFATIGEQVFG